MEEHQLFHCKQYRFRAKHNTIDERAELIEKIRSSKKIINVPVALIDLKKRLIHTESFYLNLKIELLWLGCAMFNLDEKLSFK